MIPILSVPILSGPEHLRAMLASVDVPVGETILVDNGDVLDGSWDERVVVKPRVNLGVGQSWNFVIKNFDAPWWVFSNHDLVFAPGDLQRLVEAMEGGVEVATLGGYFAFAVSVSVIDKVGLFDENFAPAYHEDNDWDYRCRLAGVKVNHLPAALTHRVSSTLMDDAEYKAQNMRTYAKNRQFYGEKWGGGPGLERHETPFDAGGDIRDWRLAIDRVREQRWTRAVDR